MSSLPLITELPRKKRLPSRTHNCWEDLSFKVMTQHIREIFKSPRKIAGVLEPFDVTQQMEMKVMNATGRAPLSKVPGTDLIMVSY